MLAACLMLSACSLGEVGSATPPAAPASQAAAGLTATGVPPLLPTAALSVAAASPCDVRSGRPASEGGELADATAVAQPSSTMSMTVSYDTETNTIVLRAGAPAGLPALSRALARPAALRELAPGEWLLAANLRVERGAVLRISGPDARRLKLRSDAGGFVWIKALGGQLAFADTCVTSWDAGRDGADENYDDGRAFVLARDGAHMDIRDSELSYLGYDANESYGVAWRTAGTTGSALNSRFGHNFYGLYSYEASDLVIRGNEVHHSVLYGIDPHTRSNHLLIESNISHHNGKHGIILAEECTDSVIRANTVYSNTLHGIVLFQHSNRNLVEGNTSYGNELQGINVNDSSNSIIRGNTAYGNAEAGIGLGQGAADNQVAGNTVSNNLKDGIYLYSDATTNELRDNTVSGNARYGVYIKSEGNRIAGGNQVFGNAVGVYLNVAAPPEISREDNRIYGNREADVRTGGG
jgi:parallel beta-helix repeat protein